MNAVDVSRNDRSTSINRKALRFEERCGQGLAFKDEFGHGNVPTRYSAGLSLGLGQWCKDMMSSFEQIQQGKPSMCNLSQDRIELLEKIGSKWKGLTTARYLGGAVVILKHTRSSLDTAMFLVDTLWILLLGIGPRT